MSKLKQKPDDYINVTIELDDMDITSAETKARTASGRKGCVGNRHPADNMLQDVYIYYGTSFIRVESFGFILSSWKKFWLNRG